jgi:hypothetical protein
VTQNEIVDLGALVEDDNRDLLLQAIERKCASLRMDSEELLTHCRRADDRDHRGWEAVCEAELALTEALLATKLARNALQARTRMQAAE